MATPNKRPRRAKSAIPCRWKCGRTAPDRASGICLECCDARDARDKRIDAGLEAYTPPSLRPGHRLFERPKRVMSEAHRAKMTAARKRKADG